MKKIVTHSGSFHADDVFAVATLMLAFPNEEINIIRSRDPEILEAADIVVDVGRKNDGEKYFDHHQEGGAGKRESGIPYASFGLVWKKFGEIISTKEASDRIDASLVSSVDALDNGVDLFIPKTSVPDISVTDVICSFNPTSSESTTKDEAFLQAVDIAKQIILRKIAEAEEYILQSQKIKNTYDNYSDKRIITIEGDVDKMIIHEVLAPSEAIYAVHQYADKWAARAVRKDLESFESKKLFPLAWAGKVAETLQKITGVPDAMFCHNNRFIATSLSREGAIKLAKLALES